MEKKVFFSLNRNTLKYIALIAMLCDHFAYFTLSPVKHTILFSILRCFGRFTAPIMCYFLAEGFRYTSSKKNYIIRLGVFAIIAQIPWCLANERTLFTRKFFTHWNMIFTLFICFLFLWVWEYYFNINYKSIILVLLFAITHYSDWAYFAVAFTLIFYEYRNNPRMKYYYYSFVAFVSFIMSFYDALQMGYKWYQCLWKVGIFLVIPLLQSYNGEKGSDHPFHKWIFYIVYVLQFFVFYFMRTKGIYFG